MPLEAAPAEKVTKDAVLPLATGTWLIPTLRLSASERNKSQGPLSFFSYTFRCRQKTTQSVDTVRKRSGPLDPGAVKFHTLMDVV